MRRDLRTDSCAFLSWSRSLFNSLNWASKLAAMSVMAARRVAVELARRCFELLIWTPNWLKWDATISLGDGAVCFSYSGVAVQYCSHWKNEGQLGHYFFWPTSNPSKWRLNWIRPPTEAELLSFVRHRACLFPSEWRWHIFLSLFPRGGLASSWLPSRPRLPVVYEDRQAFRCWRTDTCWLPRSRFLWRGRVCA